MMRDDGAHARSECALPDARKKTGPKAGFCTAFRISADRYAAGGLSEFGWLDAQRQALQTALDRTRAQADRLADTAALFQALGGSRMEDDAR
ncbi:hypothetical protein WK59_23270 [Burkholderia ubonensis]|nr:hypothetical protein WK59_23270 [Burkholderia ubonensis]